MISSMKVLGLIPARGGSKGVSHKNIRMVAGKPLIAYTIEAAAGSRYLDYVVTSTDSPDIAAVARAWGSLVPFMRPDTLSRDESPTIDVVMHALDEMPDIDLVVILQPTSPLRTTEDIDACIELAVAHSCPCVSLAPATEHPRWMFYLGKASTLTPVLENLPLPTQRQAMQQPFLLNGAVYVADRQTLGKFRSFIGENTRGYLMPLDRSIDIDSESDLRAFEDSLKKAESRADRPSCLQRD